MDLTNRRDLLKALLAGGACTLCSSGVSAAFFPSMRGPTPNNGTKRLLYIFLRGGNDGVNTVVPVGDSSYQTMRRNIRVDQTGLAIAGTSHAKAHPALAQLVGPGSPDAAGRIAWLHQVGNPLGTRSHFYEMDVHESLYVPPTQSTSALNPEGWVARLAGFQNWPGTVPSAGLASFFRAFHAKLEPGSTSKVLAEVRNVDAYDFTNPPLPEPSQSIAGRLETLLGGHLAGTPYSGAAGDVAEFADFALQAIPQLQNVPTLPDPPTAGITSPSHLLFLTQIRDAMRLLAHVPDCRVAGVNFGGFDTHADQLESQDALLTTLATALRYVDDVSQNVGLVGPLFDDAMLTLVVSEFGRTARDNGPKDPAPIDPTVGTDHGIGNLAIAQGKKVQGGVHNCDPATWPDGHLAALAGTGGENAVPALTDFRAIYSEILREWFRVRPNQLHNVLLNLSDPVPPTLVELDLLAP